MSDFKEIAHKTVAELFDMLKEKVAELTHLKLNSTTWSSVISSSSKSTMN